VEPRVVNWNLVSKGETEEEKRLNATYIISVARKLGCSIFLLPEDIMEVNQKMILTLTASIMYWSLQQQPADELASPQPSEDATSQKASSEDGEDSSSVAADSVSNLTTDEDVSSVAAESVSNLTIDEEVSSVLAESSPNLTVDDASSQYNPQHVGNGNGDASPDTPQYTPKHVENGNGDTSPDTPQYTPQQVENGNDVAAVGNGATDTP